MFNMADCKSVKTSIELVMKLSAHEESKPMDATLYMLLVGSLMQITTRYAAGIILQFMAYPKAVHWKATKRVLLYMKELCIIA